MASLGCSPGQGADGLGQRARPSSPVGWGGRVGHRACRGPIHYSWCPRWPSPLSPAPGRATQGMWASAGWGRRPASPTQGGTARPQTAVMALEQGQKLIAPHASGNHPELRPAQPWGAGEPPWWRSTMAVHKGCPGHLGGGVPPKRLTPWWPSGVTPSVGNWGPLDTRSLPPELQPGLQGHEPAVIESLMFPSRASGLEAACFPAVAS